MKTKTYFLQFLLLFIAATITAQGLPTATLHVNNAKVTVHSNGAMFVGNQFITNPETGQPELSTMKAAGIWMAGVDPGGNLKGSVQLYNEDGKTDFTPGLFHPEGQLQGVFRVAKEDIEEDIADFEDNGIIDDPNPNVFGWPGNENPHFSQYHNSSLPMPSGCGYANFWDEDQDAVYDPEKGDYPIYTLRGCE